MSKTFKVAQIYGSHVFDDALMKKSLDKDTYAELRKVANCGAELSIKTAEKVANAMKEWAISHGATHFTHWFQPLTGVTAEKHVSFIGMPTSDNKVVSEFSGKELVKGELDASSFPNGGLRATFEARGYTTWDCTSPAFLKEDMAGIVLCIPTAFCSFSGEALDLKTPLLRSMEAVNKASIKLLRALGNKKSKRVISMSGAEQEYFLISREKFNKRKDLVYTGRTLFGSMPAKDQESMAHYSGSISERVGAFMKEVNEELWKCGVPAKIQHNEFAPSQHEICPIFATSNIASDQNQLTMEILRKVAKRHKLECLLHEKPFNEINGSGKHNNWSLITDDGINLMDPGKTEEDNLRFLLVTSCIIKAVDEHADLLRLSASCVGNDYRLGGDEAPPAIISVFLGEQLQGELEHIVNTGKPGKTKKGERLKTGVPFLPTFYKDTTDRNRTSPFAFNGNRFEFRMVGSSDSIASSSAVLNAIAAKTFIEAAKKLEKVKDVRRAAYKIIAENYQAHKRVIFDGNGYSKDWNREAKRRGLPNLAKTVDAIPALSNPVNVSMFEDLGIFSKTELAAREEIRYETYAKQLHIEARTMLNMTKKQILPAVINYTEKLATNITDVKKINKKNDTHIQEELLLEVSMLLSEAGEAVKSLEDAIKKADKNKDIKKKALAYSSQVSKAMSNLRTPLDKLEKCVDKSLWPFPTYGDILFEV